MVNISLAYKRCIQINGSSIQFDSFRAARRGAQWSTGWLVFTAAPSPIKAARWQHQVAVRGNYILNCSATTSCNRMSVNDTQHLWFWNSFWGFSCWWRSDHDGTPETHMGEYFKTTVSQLVQILQFQLRWTYFNIRYYTKAAFISSTFHNTQTRTHTQTRKEYFTAGSPVHLSCLCSLGSGLQTQEFVHSVKLWQSLHCSYVGWLRNIHSEKPYCGTVDLWSIETFASVFLPAPVNGQPYHCQHAQAHDGEEEGEEELDSAHPLLLDFHCKAKWDERFIIRQIVAPCSVQFN